MASVRLILSYQGTQYHGWQVQPSQVTVQQKLEEAYTAMTGLQARMNAAGRTDAGVHAAAQVVCFENLSPHEPERLREGMNYYLPEDIAILSAEKAASGFDPRRSAVGKHYRYQIHNSWVRPVLMREFCWHLREAVSLEVLQAAATPLLGRHDFSAFRSSGCEAKSPVRRIDALCWQSQAPLLILDVWGQGFLKQMVRNLVGTMVEIGRGRWQPEQMSKILLSRDRRQAGPTAPARGLCMRQVFYEQSTYQQAWE